MSPVQLITASEALEIGIQLKVDWTKVDFEEFRRGLEIEFEHHRMDHRQLKGQDPLLLVAKITLYHIRETPGYYLPTGS